MTVTTQPVRISLLGEVRLEVDNRIVPLPQREGLLRLFVRLVLARGQPQRRRALAFSLWPDVPEADALANLRRHLHLLRSALPPTARSFLTISPQAVTWADSLTYWLDVRAFTGDSDHVDELEAIVGLYGGDLAAEIYTDEVIMAQREALRSRYLALLKKLVQLCQAQGQPKRGLHWARRLTEQDPWDEEAVRLQMTLEASLGDRTAAIKTYQRLADSLARELRAQPMPETMALYSAILNRRPLQPAPAPAALWLLPANQHRACSGDIARRRRAARCRWPMRLGAKCSPSPRPCSPAAQTCGSAGCCHSSPTSARCVRGCCPLLSQTPRGFTLLSARR
jgi:DNA-binding SARP family transcriptional activator